MFPAPSARHRGDGLQCPETSTANGYQDTTSRQRRSASCNPTTKVVSVPIRVSIRTYLLHILCGAVLVLSSRADGAIDQGLRSDCQDFLPLKSTNIDTNLDVYAKRRDWEPAKQALLSGAIIPSNVDAGLRRRLLRLRRSLELLPASAHGDVREVRRLLAAGADPNIDAAEGYQSALSWAAKCDKPKVVTALLMHGGDVNHRFDFPLDVGGVAGSTALIEASRAGARKGVAALLAHRADVNIREFDYSKYDLNPDFTYSKHTSSTALDAATDPVIRRMLIAAGAKKRH